MLTLLRSDGTAVVDTRKVDHFNDDLPLINAEQVVPALPWLFCDDVVDVFF